MRERWGMLRHLMAKDWRYVRAWAMTSWALVAAAWAVIDLDPDLWFLTALVHVLALLAPFLVFGRLLQLDPVLGDTSFWLTRPIDRRLQLASKMAVGFGAVLGPCLLLSVLPLAFRGLDLAPRDYALAVGSMMVRYLFIAWVMLVVGGVARSLAETFLLATAFVGMIVLGTKVYERVWIPADFVHEPSLRVGLAVLLPLQALVSLYVLYRWRRLAPAAAAFVLAGMAIIAVGREWRWNLMAPLMAKTLGKSAGTRIDWPIRAQILAEHGLRSSEEVGGSGRALLVRFEGIPDGVSLVHTAYETTATLWNGRQVPSVQQTDWRMEDDPERHWIPSPIEAGLGCPRRSSTSAIEHDVQVSGNGLGPESLARLEGRLRFLVVRTSVSQRARVFGGSLRFPGGRIVARHGRDGEAVVLREERLAPSPFPWPHQPPSPQLFDPVSGDCLVLEMPAVHRGGGTDLPLAATESRYPDWSRRRVFREMARGPIPESTEMVFLEREVLGAFELPFTYVEPTRPPEAAVSPAKQRARDALWEKWLDAQAAPETSAAK